MNDWIGLRRLDRAHGWPKGTAFKAFKAQRSRWSEGREYVVLHYERDRARIEELKRAGEIYASSVNAVLVSPALASSLAHAVT